MKKFAVLLFAALLVVAFTTPASALENVFGGYWRVRGYMQANFTGEDETEAQDLARYDTRTRLYYTAVLNDHLKLVNKFEMDAVFGDGASYGDIGADGVNIEVKNSYAEFTIASWLFRAGTQPWYVSRGLIVDDDASGFLALYMGETWSLALADAKAFEGGMGKDANDGDVEFYALIPSFHLSEALKLTGNLVYIPSDNATPMLGVGEDLALGFAGLDVDYKGDMFGMWGTVYFNFGGLDDVAGTDYDFSGYLFALGASTNLGAAGVHGEFLYASGDDDPTDDDMEDFQNSGANSYYWAEIMGYGIFDNQVSNNAPADGYTANGHWYLNLGLSMSPMDKVKIAADIYYAELAEDVLDADGDEVSDLGTEVDVKLTYQLVEGLNWDFVGAYLFAGDATTLNVDDDANPYELGTRLSLSF